MQSVLRRTLLGKLKRGLKVFPVFDEFGAQPAHRRVLLRAVAVRDHDGRAQAVAPGGEGHRLAVVAARGGDDPAHRGLTHNQPGEILQGTPHLERTDRGVVFMFHP